MPPILLLFICIIIVLSLVKIVLFYKFRMEHDNWHFLFYFPSINIVLTSTVKRKKFKLFQNFLSILILVSILMYCLMLFIIPDEEIIFKKNY